MHQPPLDSTQGWPEEGRSFERRGPAITRWPVQQGDGDDQGGEDPLERLRRSVVINPPGRAITRWQVQLGIGVLTALVLWPLAAWDSGDEPIKTEVAGDTLERTPPPSAEVTASTVTTAVAGTATSTTAPSAPVVVPSATATTRTPTTAPPTTATTRATTSTTSTTTTAPRAVRRQAASQVFPGVQVTMTASPPVAGLVRTTEFQVTAEFGDTRVLRVVHLDFGDGSGVDVDIRAWNCWDPAAPNPHVVSGPSHTYSGAGTYPVVATVRTGVCVAEQDEPISEETVALPLPLVVP